jgi:hypothetical protein
VNLLFVLSVFVFAVSCLFSFVICVCMLCCFCFWPWLLYYYYCYYSYFWSQWPRGLRRRSTAARLLLSWVRITPGSWMFVCCVCCVLSGKGLCDELITRSEGSYRLWRVVVCDHENLVDEEAIARARLQSQRKKKCFYVVLFLFLVLAINYYYCYF